MGSFLSTEDNGKDGWIDRTRVACERKWEHEMEKSAERVLYSRHTAMVGNNPLKFLFFVLLIPLCGVGVLMLFLWWLECLGTTLTVTNLRTILSRGILSKFTNDVLHQDVRNVRVKQTFLQRIFRVGYLGISSSAQSSIEIEVFGIPFPEHIKELVYQCRSGEAPEALQSKTFRAKPPPVAGGPPPLLDFRDSQSETPRVKPQPAAVALPFELISGGTPKPEKPSRIAEYFSSQEFRDTVQRLLDSLIYVSSFKWVSNLPDWAQPMVWGLAISVPFVILLIVIFRVIR
jgi:Bacterial PH domain